MGMKSLFAQAYTNGCIQRGQEGMILCSTVTLMGPFGI